MVVVVGLVGGVRWSQFTAKDPPPTGNRGGDTVAAMIADAVVPPRKIEDGAKRLPLGTPMGFPC